MNLQKSFKQKNKNFGVPINQEKENLKRIEDFKKEVVNQKRDILKQLEDGNIRCIKDFLDVCNNEPHYVCRRYPYNPSFYSACLELCGKNIYHIYIQKALDFMDNIFGSKMNLENL